ncbi:HipA N-terminal domain-containing protein [Nonomuraea sp. B12E4]|uniref:HipA N-terminal domain-containing protein n=1 Tax=Nonomuraea sp. B12E4 TaxID=3153564 RepID=UPI00325F6617
MTDEVTAGVFLGDRRVGTLRYREGNTWFDYDDRAPVHPVLGQAFEANPDKRRSASGSVPEWFANLLPEQGSGLRNLVGRELGRSNPHDFQVLMFLGEDLPGNVAPRARPELPGAALEHPRVVAVRPQAGRAGRLGEADDDQHGDQRRQRLPVSGKHSPRR